MAEGTLEEALQIGQLSSSLVALSFGALEVAADPSPLELAPGGHATRGRQVCLGLGEGRSKKEAEQSAAFQALKKIRSHRLAKKLDQKVLSD